MNTNEAATQFTNPPLSPDSAARAGQYLQAAARECISEYQSHRTLSLEARSRIVLSVYASAEASARPQQGEVLSQIANAVIELVYSTDNEQPIGAAPPAADLPHFEPGEWPDLHRTTLKELVWHRRLVKSDYVSGSYKKPKYIDILDGLVVGTVGFKNEPTT